MSVPAIAQQLTAAGVPVFPCWPDKNPVPTNGLHDATLNLKAFAYWPSPLVGVAVPPDVLVIDVDLYKGMTTAIIDAILGVALDWDNSFLQRTPGGGLHHAFYCPTEVRQGSDLFLDTIGKGFDTRCPGRGYVCSGGDYSTDDALGILKLSAPVALLPPLPPEAVAVLAMAPATDVPAPLPTGDRDIDEIKRMLSHLDADCSRDEWRTVAMGLKHHFHDDDGSGFVLLDEWSATATGLDSAGRPMYDAYEVRKMWGSIKPASDSGRTITLASVAKLAIARDYLPASNAAAIFGEDTAPGELSVPLTTIEALIERINADGGKPECTEQLTTLIKHTPCSGIQRSAMVACLSRVLKDHGLKITEKDLKEATRPDSVALPAIPRPVNPLTRFKDLPVAPVEGLGTVHTTNALMLMTSMFNPRLVRYVNEPHWWTGRQWEPVAKYELVSKITHAFVGGDFGKSSNIDGTDKVLRGMLPDNGDLAPAHQVIFFRNGVLDPMQPELGVQPHNPEYKNVTTLDVDYTPGGAKPEWDRFIADIFDMEPERAVLLQEIVGWCLIGHNLNHHKAIALDGASRSGKGTIIEVIDKILGASLVNLGLGQLADNKALSQLRAATLAVDTDSKTPARNDASTVHGIFNKLTANEPLSIPLLYDQTPWRGRLNCKLMIACNGIPVMTDDSGAAPGRWVILKFTKSFLGREDLTLAERLRLEAPAIAAWAVEGLQRLMTNGTFTLPESSIEASKAHTETSAPLRQYADEHLELHPSYKVHGRDLWASYKQWCNMANYKLPNRQQFLQALTRTLQSEGVTFKSQIKINSVNSNGLAGVRLINAALGVTPITTAKGKDAATVFDEQEPGA